MYQVKNGAIVNKSLPKTGYINGQAVSNYHLLDSKILQAEGWLPTEEVKPVYDKQIEHLVFDKYEILKAKVNIIYKAELIPEPTPDPVQVLKERFNSLEAELVEKAVISDKEELIADK